MGLSVGRFCMGIWVGCGCRILDIDSSIGDEPWIVNFVKKTGSEKQ